MSVKSEKARKGDIAEKGQGKYSVLAARYLDGGKGAPTSDEDKRKRGGIVGQESYALGEYSDACKRGPRPRRRLQTGRDPAAERKS